MGPAIRKLGMPGKIGEEVCPQIDLPGGLGDGLAGVPRLDGADLVRVVADQVGEAAQDPRSLPRGNLGPDA